MKLLMFRCVVSVCVTRAVPPPATPDPSAKEQIPPPADSAAKEAKSSTGPEQLDDGGDVGGNVELESMPLEGSNDSTSDSAGLAVSLALSPKRSITPPPLPSVNSFSTVSNSSTVSSSLSTAEEDPLPPHFRILQVAHETLGRYDHIPMFMCRLFCCMFDSVDNPDQVKYHVHLITLQYALQAKHPHSLYYIIINTKTVGLVFLIFPLTRSL